MQTEHHSRMGVFRASRLSAIEASGPRHDLSVRIKRREAPIGAEPLVIGSRLLGSLGMADDWLPESGPWLPPHHCSILTASGAFVFSSSGIVGLGSGDVIEETLDHTSPLIDGFGRLQTASIKTSDGGMREEGGLVILPDEGRRLSGKYISLLIGSYENYFHWLMSIARLGLLDAEDKTDLSGILIPADLSPNHLEAAEAVRTRLGVPFQQVERGKGYWVERLVVPWNPLSVNGADADALTALRTMTAASPAPLRTRSIYVDRRRASARRLLNEDEVVRRLEGKGIEPIDTGALTLFQQAELFRNARLIVGPHGAGLTNIVFADPGVRVIELMPSGTMNWCYRTLAASCGHYYDAVIGRTHLLNETSQHEPWAVSVTHILSAIETASGD